MIKVRRVLIDRLDTDRLVQEGLLDEIKELRAIACASPDAVVAGPSDESAVQQTDYTVGIYQSIGEFCRLFSATPTHGACQDTKSFMIFSLLQSPPISFLRPPWSK
jgi:hypothetical protein